MKLKDTQMGLRGIPLPMARELIRLNGTGFETVGRIELRHTVFFGPVMLELL